MPLVSDVDGDGVDEVAVARPATLEVFLRYELLAGPADESWAIGDPGDVALLADWDGDGAAEPAVWRPGSWAFHLPGGVLAGPRAGPGWLPIAGPTGG